MTDYWKKWKEALDSLKRPLETSIDELKYRSEERVKMLKRKLPDIDFSALETQESEKAESAEEELTLRERYGFKKINYD